ncbi:MAG: tRNA uridine-5-carboxymethylaminomethyl(34) synthesis GTPase MnmE [Treponema sp.]|jgi:tRNA modification GTPase|nr:tRNA uridine-5-carboxymethylaminomethyl(34) synthesis GTPase MnmE [Treponema sp.]
MTASYGDDSPIAAFATHPGSSALTLIRCSGNGAVELAAAVFSDSEKLRQAAGNTVIHGWIIAADDPPDSAEKIDEVLVSVFRVPKSYTGEDCLDISCHGGIAAGHGVMAALHTAGFRDALPGEFTFRAFMNGKLDLTRSESVMELVSARTDAGRRRAVSRLSGVLKQEIDSIKKMLVAVLSGAEIFLDYSEDEIGADDDETAGRLPARLLAVEALGRLKKLAASWKRERIYQEGLLAVIAGRPNAGKSSLFNLLLNEDRSIVTEIPGTTRDWIEGCVSIGGIPLRLADTAGLRESADPVEKIGVERSRELLDEADLVLYLIDGAAGCTKEDHSLIARLEQDGAACKPFLLLWNKADIAPLPSAHKIAPDVTAGGIISVSAKTGVGMAELTVAITAIAEKMAGTAAAENQQNAALGSLRQKNLAESAAAALEEALSLADREEPLDIIAPLLRSAVNALGEITGEVSTAAILEEMFSRFCVGK